MLQELSSFFGKVPKESYELLRRNIELRNTLEKIYRSYKAGVTIDVEDFDPVFNEIFRFFFRPLELAIASAKPIALILPTQKNLSLFETFGNTLEAYSDFLESLKNHLQLAFGFFEKEGYAKNVMKDLMKDAIAEFDSQLYDFGRYKLFADFPYILTNRALKHISKSFEAWERFGDDFFKFKNLMKTAYRNSVEEFINLANSKEFESYLEFANEFYSITAKHFDELLKSDEYLRTQNSMNSNLMDHLYHFRRFAEEVLEISPLNPLATISQIDEAYRRITDLKRKIMDLERKIEEIERNMEAAK